MKNSKGFTLIELLVVIAIIGILASVVLASLNTARSKGEDASAIASINSIKTNAELYYDDNSDYGAADALCSSTDPDIAGLISAAESANGQTAVCGSSAGAYAVSIPLASASNATEDNFCVDSSGFSGKQADAAVITDGNEACS